MLLDNTACGPGIPRLVARGFRVAGCLDLSNARIDCPVRFEFCVFDEGVSLVEAKTRSVRIVDCELPSLDANTAFVDGHLELVGSCLGWLSLYRTQVSGHVELSGAELSQAGATAINADYPEVGAALYGHDLTCRGAVRLPGARIGGTLELDGAHLISEDDWALVADMITVGGDMRCRDGFRAIGTVGLTSARIGGRLFLGGDAPPGHVGPGGPRQARGPGFVSGPVDMRHAKLGGLNDEPANWPQRLHLDGLVL
jgi:prepilin-type processing-associated H-X9-DG protein